MEREVGARERERGKKERKLLTAGRKMREGKDGIELKVEKDINRDTRNGKNTV